MHIDKFNNPIFDNSDLFNMIYHGCDITDPDILVDRSIDIDKFTNAIPTNFIFSRDEIQSIDDYDKKQQLEWFMPSEYYTLNVRAFCLSKCKTLDERKRVIEEFTQYEKRGMLCLLQWLKYFVDICDQYGVVWGVGRGSSVASYVLYLIGVHRIDSLKYNLDWREFLR